jgi:hypothetical protein
MLLYVISGHIKKYVNYLMIFYQVKAMCRYIFK